MPRQRPIVYHIPVCPFSQRLEILLELKGLRDGVEFRVVDITRPRDPALLALTGGTTMLPVLRTPEGKVVKESLVILRYLEDLFPDPPVAQADPYARAVENMLIAREDAFATHGYRFVMNRDPARRAALAETMDTHYARLDAFLSEHAPGRDFLFPRFGMAETVFTPLHMRFWFLEYYEGYEIPRHLARLRRWVESSLAHPAAQQVCHEEIVKLYYDYAMGKGNGALPPGRSVSSFVFAPHWSRRPWPPRDKWAPATDAQLGLA